MAKIAAIEIDDKLVRVVVAKTAGSSFELTDAFEVEVKSGFEANPSEFGTELAAALGNRVGRCESLISFGRGQSELRVISVPKVPDEELPEMVRFQALRQFTNCAEDAPVDFLPLNEVGDTRTILAATVPKAVISQLVAGCQTAGLQVKGVKMRATCSTALCQSIDPNRKNYIILDPSDGTFNLEVVAFGTLCLTRTIRVASGDNSRQIVREIRRTLAAANNQVAEYEPNELVVFGTEAEFPGLAEAMAADLQFDVSFVNPFDHAGGIESSPANVGMYGALIGLLVAEVTKSTDTIDFLNPRRKVVRKDGGRVKLLAGLAVAILFIGMAALGYLILSQKASQIREIERQITQMAPNDKIAEEIIGNVGKVEEFDNSQAVWLRELANLSEDFPEPDLAMLDSAVFNLDPNDEDEGVKIDLKGLAYGIDVIPMIEDQIREDESYVANFSEIQLTEKEKNQDYYTHKLTGKVTRSAELMEPEVSEEEIDAYMKPRQKANETPEANKAANGNAKDPSTENADETPVEEKQEDSSEPKDNDTEPEKSATGKRVAEGSESEVQR